VDVGAGLAAAGDYEIPIRIDAASARIHMPLVRPLARPEASSHCLTKRKSPPVPIGSTGQISSASTTSRGQRMVFELLLGGGVAACLFLYLFYTLIRPEKF
jgi:K+-transporting ATPase KdpF subunit